MTINKLNNILNMHSNNNTDDYSKIFSYMHQYYNAHSLTCPTTIDIIGTNGNSIVDMNNKIISLPPLMSTDKGCSIYHIDITIKDGEYRKLSIYPIMNKERLLHTSHLYIYK